MEKDLDYYALPPFRCTCNKPIGALYGTYTNLVASGMTREEAFASLGMNRYCCRAAFINPPLIYWGPGPNAELISGVKNLNIRGIAEQAPRGRLLEERAPPLGRISSIPVAPQIPTPNRTYDINTGALRPLSHPTGTVREVVVGTGAAGEQIKVEVLPKIYHGR